MCGPTLLEVLCTCEVSHAAVLLRSYPIFDLPTVLHIASVACSCSSDMQLESLVRCRGRDGARDLGDWRSGQALTSAAISFAHVYRIQAAITTHRYTYCDLPIRRSDQTIPIDRHIVHREDSANGVRLRRHELFWSLRGPARPKRSYGTSTRFQSKPVAI